MFDELYAKNKLKPQFIKHLKLRSKNNEKLNEALNKELTFIKELISGGKIEKVGCFSLQLFNTSLDKLYKDHRQEL